MMKKIIILVTSIVLTTVLFGCGSNKQKTWSDDTVISFTDEKMAKRTRDIIGVPEGNITYGMVKDIKEFSGDEFNDISPIKYFTGLYKLEFYSTPKDISAISNLTDLTYLKIWEFHSDDLNDLGNLSNLDELYLYNSYGLKDISAIKKLDNLTVLHISGGFFDGGNTIDYDPLENLHNLKRLEISNSNITDLKFVEKMDNLTELEVYYCHNLTDISSIGKIKNLSKIKITECGKLTDIGSVKELNGVSIFIKECGCDDYEKNWQ